MSVQGQGYSRSSKVIHSRSKQESSMFSKNENLAIFVAL